MTRDLGMWRPAATSPSNRLGCRRQETFSTPPDLFFQRLFCSLFLKSPHAEEFQSSNRWLVLMYSTIFYIILISDVDWKLKVSEVSRGKLWNRPAQRLAHRGEASYSWCYLSNRCPDKYKHATFTRMESGDLVKNRLDESRLVPVMRASAALFSRVDAVALRRFEPPQTPIVSAKKKNPNLFKSLPTGRGTSSPPCRATFADCPPCCDNSAVLGDSSPSPWLRGGRPALSLLPCARTGGVEPGEQLPFFWKRHHLKMVRRPGLLPRRLE